MRTMFKTSYGKQFAIRQFQNKGKKQQQENSQQEKIKKQNLSEQRSNNLIDYNKQNSNKSVDCGAYNDKENCNIQNQALGIEIINNTTQNRSLLQSKFVDQLYKDLQILSKHREILEKMFLKLITLTEDLADTVSSKEQISCAEFFSGFQSIWETLLDLSYQQKYKIFDYKCNLTELDLVCHQSIQQISAERFEESVMEIQNLEQKVLLSKNKIELFAQNQNLKRVVWNLQKKDILQTQALQDIRAQQQNYPERIDLLVQQNQALQLQVDKLLLKERASEEKEEKLSNIIQFKLKTQGPALDYYQKSYKSSLDSRQSQTCKTGQSYNKKVNKKDRQCYKKAKYPKETADLSSSLPSQGSEYNYSYGSYNIGTVQQPQQSIQSNSNSSMSQHSSYSIQKGLTLDKQREHLYSQAFKQGKTDQISSLKSIQKVDESSAYQVSPFQKLNYKSLVYNIAQGQRSNSLKTYNHKQIQNIKQILLSDEQLINISKSIDLAKVLTQPHNILNIKQNIDSPQDQYVINMKNRRLSSLQGTYQESQDSYTSSKKELKSLRQLQQEGYFAKSRVSSLQAIEQKEDNSSESEEADFDSSHGGLSPEQNRMVAQASCYQQVFKDDTQTNMTTSLQRIEDMIGFFSTFPLSRSQCSLYQKHIRASSFPVY